MMRTYRFRFSSLILLASAVLPGLTAAPTITSVANAASSIGFNSPIAQGSIFVIYGTGLGPTTTSIAPSAFQTTTLSNTSIAITVGATTVNALMYYTSATQVAALLPSNTPTGSGMFTVTYNGSASAAVTHTVVANNVGIFTVDSSGQGPGIVTNADYSLVSAAKGTPCGGPYTSCGAALPGDILILWATGLGPVNGSDAAGAGLAQAISVPLTLWLGGVQAAVSYQGRSGCCIGEDQLVFTVPAGVPTGCAVPLVVQIGTGVNTISNTTFLAVGAKGSRSCTPVNPALAAINVEQDVMAGPVTFGAVNLVKDSNAAGTALEDDAQFQFEKIVTYNPGSQPFFATYVDDLPLGTCVVYGNFNGGGNAPAASAAALDAGTNFTVKGPNSSVAVVGIPGQFGATINSTATFLIQGDSYTVTGAGGANVGPFSATITYPVKPTLTSPQAVATITRANGLTVTWTGAPANEYVQIEITSATDNTGTVGSEAMCNAPVAAGTFTIPPYVLLALPAGNFASFSFNPIVPEVPFTASGLTIGLLQTQSDGVAYGFGTTTGSITLK